MVGAARGAMRHFQTNGIPPAHRQLLIYANPTAGGAASVPEQLQSCGRHAALTNARRRGSGGGVVISLYTGAGSTQSGNVPNAALGSGSGYGGNLASPPGQSSDILTVLSG